MKRCSSAAFLCLLLVTTSALPAAQALDPAAYRLVDLTHPFNDRTIYWPTSPSTFKLQRLAYGDTSGGFFFAANSFCAPELLRLRGEALRAQAPGKDVEAERAFREALALARRQTCRPLELRAAVSLARLLRDGERSAQARDVLVPIYDAFTEGFSFPDLQNAKKLIAELNS